MVRSRGAQLGLGNQTLRAIGFVFTLLPFAARATQCPQDPPSITVKSPAGKVTATTLINGATSVCRRPAGRQKVNQARALTGRIRLLSSAAAELTRGLTG